MSPAFGRLVPGPALMTAALLLGGCGLVGQGPEGQDGEPGDPAVWQLLTPEDVNPTSRLVVVGVNRLGCSGGETGEVLQPAIRYEEDRILIRTAVEPLPPGDYTCQGNPPERLEIALEEEIGIRALVDAECEDAGAGGTASCEDPVRWAPPPGLTRADGVPDWRAPASYDFTVESYCGERGFIGTYDVTVRSGRVESVEAVRPGWAVADRESTPTISDMLEMAREGDAEVWVDGDGVPRWLDLDPRPEAMDDEACFLVTDYREG